MNKDVWVIIPAYNEEKTIKDVILKVKEYCDNVVVVDDGSQDKTANSAQEAGAVVLEHMINLGKGAALKTGCDYAYKKRAQKLILMDADGQHEAEEIPQFVDLLNNFDIVFSYRGFNKKMPWIFKLGNQFLTWITCVLYKMKLNDTQSGYRALTRDTYRKIRWKVNDYSVENEIIANAGKKHLKYKQIPIQTIYKDNYKGTTILDGLKIILNMFFWRLR